MGEQSKAGGDYINNNNHREQSKAGGDKTERREQTNGNKTKRRGGKSSKRKNGGQTKEMKTSTRFVAGETIMRREGEEKEGKREVVKERKEERLVEIKNGRWQSKEIREEREQEMTNNETEKGENT